MSGLLAPKVFWTEVTVVEVPGGYTPRLDGRAIKTPLKADFALPTLALAEAAAEEWRAQDDRVKPETMPITRAANSAIDKVSAQKPDVVDVLAAYGDSDLTCYRADYPAALAARQAAAWDPLLDWAADTFGARLKPVVGVMPEPQSADALARLRGPLDAMTAFELTALHDLIALSGSLVIGLAADAKAWPAEALWDASRIDETWQIEQWGEDEEATAAVARKERDFLQAARLLDLCRANP